LNIEQFCQRKFNKIETKKILGNLKSTLDIIKKPLMNGFFEGDSLLFRPKVGEILNFE
jgi:hypothetical protein